MKTIILNIAATCGLLFISNQQLCAQEVTKGPQISFEKETHDFGQIPFRGNATCTFELKNTGKEPLIISKVGWSCSCTVAEWPTEPIAPGKKALIKVRYDSARVGKINKSFTVQSNAVNEPEKKLYIKGEVLPQQELPVESAPDQTN